MTPNGRLLTISILVLGLGSLYPLQQWINDASPPENINEEKLFLSSGSAIKRMSLGLNALAADLYWIRTVQYFGRKVVDSGVPLASAATKDIRMDLLAPLLDIVVTLDPQHIPAYRFGAIFLPERDMPAATALLEKGIEQNPNEWRLYQDLGYIYWQAGNVAVLEQQNDYYSKSALWFEKGGTVAGAPWWMRDLGGLMRIKGGSRDAARAIYSTYLTSDDANIKAQAVERMKQLRSLDEIDAINSLIVRYKEQKGECPPNLSIFAAALQSIRVSVDEKGFPLDPDGFEYAYDTRMCKAELAIESTISR